MKYKHRDPMHVCERITINKHHIIWDAVCEIIAVNGFISGVRLDSLSIKLGQGSNKGNTDYARYLIKDGFLVPVS